MVSDLGDGVGEATPVRLHGLTVGEVVDHRPHGPGRQLITLSVDDERFGELSDELDVRFISGTVFGSTAVELVPTGSGDPLRPAEVLDLGNGGVRRHHHDDHAGLGTTDDRRRQS